MISNKIYPDTGVGAMSFLKDAAKINLTGAIASADHKIHGVWLVEHRQNKGADMSIVYLKSYKDGSGNIRDTNTFETV